MKNEGINQINYLEIHTYIPFKINADITFVKLCEKILVSKIIQNDEFGKNIHDIFCTSVNKITNEINDELEEQNIYVKINDYECNDNPEIAELLLNQIILGGNLKIYLRNDLLDEITFRKNLVKSEFDYSKKIYGQLYVQSHDRFFLLPVKVFLTNNKEFWVIPQLIVFSNLFAFIKFEIPMADINAELLKNNEIDKNIKKIKMIDGQSIIEFINFDELTDYFISLLVNEMMLDKVILEKEFRNILLIDYDNMSASLSNLNDKLKEDIFYILSAPVPNRNIISYKREVRNFFDDQATGREDVLFILKKNGGCLTLIAKNMLEQYTEQNKDYPMIFDNLELKKIAIELNSNCEYAIIANILEKMNNTIYFLDRLGEESKKQNMTYIEYNENIIFINSIVESCYGSVIEQVEAFKNRMPLYHNVDYYEKKSKALDRILNHKKNEKELQFQKTVSFLGVIFVVLFGLPTINESLKYVKLSLYPSSDVIAYFNINQISMLLWIIIVVGIGFYLYLKK